MKNFKSTSIKFTLFAFLFIVILACNKQKSPNKLLGLWVLTHYNAGNFEYTRQNKFEEYKPGLEFKKDGILIRRRNIGHCGTPPITYKNYNKRWQQKNSKTLTLGNIDWKGNTIENYTIISTSNDILVLTKNE